MQVDTTQLRKAAAQLRADVIKPIIDALKLSPGLANEAFDSYTTARPFTAAQGSWSSEVEVMRMAAWELADALEAAADEYDQADSHSAQRLTAGR